MNNLFGLEKTINAAAQEISHHFHTIERWFGAAAVPDAEVHVADGILTGVTPFQMDGGNLDWGAWLQILGSEDTPAIVGKTHFDLRKIFIDDLERGTSTHLIQIGWGASGAAALAAGDYTEFIHKPQSLANSEDAIEFPMKRIAVGTKVWIRVKVIGQNTGTVDFWCGIHEYVVAS